MITARLYAALFSPLKLASGDTFRCLSSNPMVNAASVTTLLPLFSVKQIAGCVGEARWEQGLISHILSDLLSGTRASPLSARCQAASVCWQRLTFHRGVSTRSPQTKHLRLGCRNICNWKIPHLKTHRISESARARAERPPPEEEPRADIGEGDPRFPRRQPPRRGSAPLPGGPAREAQGPKRGAPLPHTSSAQDFRRGAAPRHRRRRAGRRPPPPPYLEAAPAAQQPPPRPPPHLHGPAPAAGHAGHGPPGRRPAGAVAPPPLPSLLPPSGAAGAAGPRAPGPHRGQAAAPARPPAPPPPARKRARASPPRRFPRRPTPQPAPALQPEPGLPPPFFLITGGRGSSGGKAPAPIHAQLVSTHPRELAWRADTIGKRWERRAPAPRPGPAVPPGGCPAPAAVPPAPGPQRQDKRPQARRRRTEGERFSSEIASSQENDCPVSAFSFLFISPIPCPGLHLPAAEILSKTQQICFSEALPAHLVHDCRVLEKREKHCYKEVYG